MVFPFKKETMRCVATSMRGTPDKNFEHEGNKEHMILDYPPLILKNSHLQGKIFQVFYKV